MVKVLVLGATGNQGGATARALLASKQQQHTVRVLARDPTSAKARELAALGAEVVQCGDWATDAAGLERAFAGGVEALFFFSVMRIADLEAELRGAQAVLAAAQKAGSVRTVVYSNATGVDRYKERKGWDAMPALVSYWTTKAKIEELIKEGGFENYTFLRPGEFMTNYTSEASRILYPELLAEGVIRTAFPSTHKLGVIDPFDIGRAAAAAIESPETYSGQALELVAEHIALGDLAAQLSEGAGKSVRVETLSPEQAAELAKTNPLVAGQIIRLDPSWAPVEARDYGLGFRTFKDHVRENREEIREVFKHLK